MPNSWQAPIFGLLSSAALLVSAPAMGQSPVVSPYIASTPAQTLQAAGVQISGDVHIANGSMQLGNGSTITAGNETLPIALARGGELKLCATTSIHLARDRSIQVPDASGLMLGLDRGALEAHYPTSKYSDVLLTPDLRILISGPGDTNVSVRVNRQGDTCIDNRGPNAPYITVTSQFEDGLYRVQPGQHVSFQHGSLREVVDNETEPCGCPPPMPAAVVTSTPNSGHPVGGPSSTPADTAFPLAVSEGLSSAPLPPTTPFAAPGEVHAQVAVPFRYNGNLPTVGTTGGSAEPAAGAVAMPPPSPAAPAPTPMNMPAPQPPPVPPGSLPAPAVASVQATIAPIPQPQHQPSRGFFHRIGRFFSRLFGAEQ